MQTSYLDPIWTERFTGVDRLYGAGSIERLSKCRVAIVGLGGVGSWVAEALARSAVGHLRLLDADDICVSNTNRQLPAMEGTFGHAKVAAMAARCQRINPLMDVEPVPAFITATNLATQLDADFDLVVDACDNVASKVEIIAWCRRRKLPVVVSGSAGGRTDSTLVRARDLSRTEQDAMLALVRKRLRSDFNFPRNRDRYFGVTAIYSLENVRYPQADGSVCGMREAGGEGSLKLDCGGGLGAATHVTGAFAFAMAGKAIELLLKTKQAS
ncbi:tRNA threonylcarbamoyladenosine dehydratase [Cognatilysobacter lacus]|uniref:tRNA threonylcarbamoyladenosine dehydratase n=1 Tax=Cognatilysobacter lacus TaxID=1643323 RepID=A0A5D8Z7T4_9GAMM|nr:tRNA threonylcarbamoyladenosine dehydratase [Lysobacter lacus]TZF90182.1 tRNA threonylcarbamoyladenosine dehydratase [Lysobacter lacus]